MTAACTHTECNGEGVLKIKNIDIDPLKDGAFYLRGTAVTADGDDLNLLAGMKTFKYTGTTLSQFLSQDNNPRPRLATINEEFKSQFFGLEILDSKYQVPVAVDMKMMMANITGTGTGT